MKSRSKLILEKSIAAILSAIEIYNKPDFKYREEIFSILCVNAWELLLKAKVINLSGNNIASLYNMEYVTLKNGKQSKVKHPKKNRTGNPTSISILNAYRIITDDYGVKLNKAVKDNLITMIEIRDNSIHLVNDDITLSKKVQEIGTASLQNYLHLVNNWFGNVLDGYNFYLMPLSLFRNFRTAKGVALNSNAKNILKFIKSKEIEYDNGNGDSDYNLTLEFDVKFQKVKSNSGISFQVTNDKNALVVQLLDEDITDKYPWDYQVLTTRLKKRYLNFKIDKKYHSLRKNFESNKKLAHVRYLNAKTLNGVRKVFYSATIEQEFDSHYTKNS